MVNTKSNKKKDSCFERFIGSQELAELLGIPLKTVYKWSSESSINDMPKYKIGKHIKFRVTEIERWIKSNHSSLGVKKYSN